MFDELGAKHMFDETIGAPGGPDNDEAGRAGRTPEEQEGSRSGSPHTPPEEGHPAGRGERGDRDVGGPTSPAEERDDATGGAPGTPPDSGFEPHS